VGTQDGDPLVYTFATSGNSSSQLRLCITGTAGRLHGDTVLRHVESVYVQVQSGTGTTPPTSGSLTESFEFYHQDHLGSIRLVTNSQGAVVSRHDYLPFGEEVPAGQYGRDTVLKIRRENSIEHRFTGKSATRRAPGLLRR